MKVNLSRKELHQISLSVPCKSIILGSILGDGSLKKYSGYKNARLSIRHSVVQKEYFFWKIHQLDEISNPKSVQLQRPSGFSKHQKLLYQSKSHEELTKLYNITYKKNKLVIKRKWLNHLTPLALAIWWLDDGSLIGHKKKGVLCTDGFEFDQVLILSKYLRVVWGIENRVGCVKRNRNGVIKEYPRIWISTKPLRIFFNIIDTYVPASMRYKIEMQE